jgi:uncharacterized ubiquitin-like protein YukD
MSEQIFTIVDPLGENEYDVQLPTDTTMQKLIPQLITALKLQPGSYAIQHVGTGRLLGPDETLAEIGAKNNDTLRITATPMAALDLNYD